MKRSRALSLWIAAAAVLGTLPVLAQAVSVTVEQEVRVRQRIQVTVPTGKAGGQKRVDAVVHTGGPGGGVTYIKGMGLPRRGTTGAQAMLTARRAAEVNALGDLAQMLVGVYVAGDAMTENEELLYSRVCTAFGGKVQKGRVFDSPKGAPEEYADEVGWNPAGYFTIVMEVPYRSIATAWCDETIQDLVKNMLKQKPKPPAEAPAADLQEAAASAPTQYANVPPPTKDIPAGCFTGVIIDCSGTDVKVGIAPKIVSESGKVVFGDKVPMEVALNEGAVGYAPSAEAALKLKSRLGANPMPTIVATASASTFAAVISDADAAKIAEANAAGHFLEACKVVFIVKGK